MKLCHNCEYKMNGGESYEMSPCSKCRAQYDPYLIVEKRLEDISYNETYASIHPAYVEDTKPSSDLMKSMAKCVLELVSMKDRYPETFRIAFTKLREPHLSYADIARIFKCKKQNIQYHLRKAVHIYDDLRHALLIDRRFN